MTAYQKTIKELYMPKPSDKKKAELEKEYARIHTIQRETKPIVDYLGHVYEQNNLQASLGKTRNRSQVASLPNLSPR